MSKTSIFITLFAILTVGLYPQRPSIGLTFTAIDNTDYVQLDSIKIMNRTQGGDTILFWPDTILTIYYVGLQELSGEQNEFQVFQSYPDPVTENTIVSLFIPDKDYVELFITDMLGRVILKTVKGLEKGTHSFRFSAGRENMYLLSARWQGTVKSMKILCPTTMKSGKVEFEYIGWKPLLSHYKASVKILDFAFSPGDTLLYIGYSDTLQSGILDDPDGNTDYTFQFATNIPCPGTSTVNYGGKEYNTIQIFSQCWLKENLDVGEMVPGSIVQSDNGALEKYCFDNDTNNCNIYGGLYLWNEMMQYSTQLGVQGICPQGWHIPTNEEWKVLEGSVDSQYGIGNPEWDDLYPLRGYDAGTNLKATSGWYENGNGTDLFGFSGLPGGFRLYDGSFDYMLYRSHWWTSTVKYDYAWHHFLRYNLPQSGKDFDSKVEFGFSVRCIKNE